MEHIVGIKENYIYSCYNRDINLRNYNDPSDLFSISYETEQIKITKTPKHFISVSAASVKKGGEFDCYELTLEIWQLEKKEIVGQFVILRNERKRIYIDAIAVDGDIVAIALRVGDKQLITLR